MEISEARQIALALPEAHEQPYHGHASYRVGKKVFATVPDAGHLNVLLAAEDAAVLVTTHSSFEPLLWGGRVCGIRVELSQAEAAPLAMVLEQAWRRVAPAALSKSRDTAT